ncbi:MAG TPA: KTSC domain-containing protein [Bryobacteraceae bacterium]
MNRILEIEFQSDMIYQYLDVPSVVHNELLEAESTGQYFNREIRDTYEFIRLERQDAAIR